MSALRVNYHRVGDVSAKIGYWYFLDTRFSIPGVLIPGPVLGDLMYTWCNLKHC